MYYSRTSDGDANDCDKLKKALSTRFQFQFQDGYRKRFREVKPETEENVRPVRHPFEELPSKVIRTFWQKQFWRLQRPCGSDSKRTVYQRLF